MRESNAALSLWSFQVNSSQAPSLYLGETSHPLWPELDFLAIHGNNAGIVVTAFETNQPTVLAQGQRRLSIFEMLTFQIAR